MPQRIINPFVRLTNRHRLIVGLILVIGVSLVLVTISMTLYVTDGTSGLDLSRPSSEQARKALQKDTIKDFPATGTLNDADYQDFLKLYSAERAKLKGYSAFNDTSMSDLSLGLDVDAASPSGNLEAQ